MLTEQEVIDMFINKVGEPPEPMQIEEYKNYTVEDLTKVLDRRLAIEQDPTYNQRLAENYMEYLYATPEQRSLWVFPEPMPQNK